MKAVGVYDQITTAFQDIVAPELHAIRGDIRVLDQRIVGVDEKISGVDARLGAKIDSVDARLTVQISALDEKDRKSTRLNSSHVAISYAVFCLKKKKKQRTG